MKEDGSGFERTNLSYMGVERQQHSMCTSGDDSFVVTGSNFKLFANKCQEYKISENCWYKLPDLTVGRFDHSSCSFRKRTIYVFGGYSRSHRDYIGSIECLQIGSPSWIQIQLKGDSNYYKYG